MAVEEAQVRQSTVDRLGEGVAPDAGLLEHLEGQAPTDHPCVRPDPLPLRAQDRAEVVQG